eukprot:2229622-Prymnesium_polylepis.1
MISGISSQPPRWICPAERQRASSTHVKQKAAQPTHHPVARDPNDALPTFTSMTSYAAGVSGDTSLERAVD